MPKRHFQRVLLEIFPFASHLYANDEFAGEICRHDRKLFEAIELTREERFPRAFCVLVTCDRKFYSELGKHPSLNTKVHVIIVEPPAKLGEIRRFQALRVARAVLLKFLQHHNIIPLS